MINNSARPHKLITAILPKGREKELVSQLVYDRRLSRINVNHARGLGRITPLRHRGIGETPEKAIVTVLVDADQADEIFEFIFYAADINRAHGGLMFQQPVQAATNFSLPEIDEEK